MTPGSPWCVCGHSGQMHDQVDACRACECAIFHDAAEIQEATLRRIVREELERVGLRPSNPNLGFGVWRLTPNGTWEFVA